MLAMNEQIILQNRLLHWFYNQKSARTICDTFLFKILKLVSRWRFQDDREKLKSEKVIVVNKRIPNLKI